MPNYFTRPILKFLHMLHQYPIARVVNQKVRTISYKVVGGEYTIVANNLSEVLITLYIDKYVAVPLPCYQNTTVVFWINTWRFRYVG